MDFSGAAKLRYPARLWLRSADPKKAFSRLVTATFPDLGFRVVRHTLRHTLATWLMRRGVVKAGGYLGMTMETLARTYAHHSPTHQSAV